MHRDAGPAPLLPAPLNIFTPFGAQTRPRPGSLKHSMGHSPNSIYSGRIPLGILVWVLSGSTLVSDFSVLLLLTAIQAVRNELRHVV